MDRYLLGMIIIPVIFSFLYLLIKSKTYYKLLSILMFVISTILAVNLAAAGPVRVEISGGLFHLIEGFIIICEGIITVYLFYVSIKNKRKGTFVLALILTLLSTYLSIFTPQITKAYFNVDKLSLVMALIINIIGTLIVIFSNNYMNHYEEHRNLRSRQRLYYFMVCIFLGAMNGLVFSDALSWIYFFWEVTTIVSFILISYNNDSEALNSGFRALFINLLGGITFAAGIILFKNMMNIDSLSQIIDRGQTFSIYSIPVLLLCIAGFAKSAQMPFQSWLLGAMVAPTPVSALLHSSTMVKAGVYLIVKLSPAYAGTPLGVGIGIFGGVSFMICSIIAVSQGNAKRVLAYSTIANLGLIISSAGMGSSIATSAAIMLIIFHALSKSLLFLCTGHIEHSIGSRDIEDMAGLINIHPFTAVLTVFGMLSMLLPPFGVLITKWISIEAAAKNPVIAVLLVIGSAFTTVFWVKWMGTLLSYPVERLESKSRKDFTTAMPLAVLGLLIGLSSIFITRLYNFFVVPEISTLMHEKSQLIAANGRIYTPFGSFNDLSIFLVLITTSAAILFVKNLIMPVKLKRVYMCGENNIGEDESCFRAVDGSIHSSRVSNLYLSNILSEEKVTKAGCIVSTSIILTVLIGGLI